MKIAFARQKTRARISQNSAAAGTAKSNPREKERELDPVFLVNFLSESGSSRFMVQIATLIACSPVLILGYSNPKEKPKPLASGLHHQGKPFRNPKCTPSNLPKLPKKFYFLIGLRPAVPAISRTWWPFDGRPTPPSHKRANLLVTGFSVLCPLVSGPFFAAHAQEVVVETPESLVAGPAPEGLRAGDFIISPEVAADLRFDSNIYNRNEIALDDFIASFRPRVTIRQDRDRHDARITFGGEFRRYFDIAAENSNQFDVRASTRLDLGSRQTVRASASLARRIERRGTFGDQFLTDEPVAYFEKEARFGYAKEGGKLEFSADLLLNEKNYENSALDGFPLELSQRDLTRMKVGVRGDYQVGSALSTFVTVAANRLDYQSTISARDSKGFSIIAGARAEPNELSFLEVGFGYLKQDFESDLETDFDGIDFYASGEWTPTPRLLITADASRTIERSPLVDVSAVVESLVETEVQYALGSKLLVGLEGGAIWQDYRGADRKEERFFANATLKYRLQPNLTVLAAIGYRIQNSVSLTGREYHGGSALVGIKWTL